MTRRARVRISLLPTLAIAAVCVLPCGCIRWPGPAGPSEVTELFGGEAGYELVAIPALADVRAYRVTNVRDGSDDGKAKLGDAVVVAGPVRPDGETLTDLSEILTDRQTYEFDSAKACKFDPGLAIQYAGAKTTLDVLFCFKCETLQVYRDGKRVGEEDFDARAKDLARIANRLFPDMFDTSAE